MDNLDYSQQPAAVQPLGDTPLAETELVTASTGDPKRSQAAGTGKPSPESRRFDLSLAEIHARGKKSAPVQPLKSKRDDGNVLYICQATRQTDPLGVSS